MENTANLSDLKNKAYESLNDVGSLVKDLSNEIIRLNAENADLKARLDTVFNKEKNEIPRARN